MFGQHTANSNFSELSTIQGQIERVTFYNEDTDFTVARLKVSGRRDLVTAIGTMMAPTPGQVVRVTGQWANHPEFGEQFKIVRYTTLVPATVAAIEKYIGSGHIKSIVPVMTKRMVLFWDSLTSFRQAATLDIRCECLKGEPRWEMKGKSSRRPNHSRRRNARNS